MIDKKTGQAAYTVLSFGGFLGLGSEEYTLPWKQAGLRHRTKILIWARSRGL